MASTPKKIDGHYYGYDSGSGDGLFEPPPDPVMDSTKLAMGKFAPSADRQQRVRDYFRGKDRNGSGKVSLQNIPGPREMGACMSRAGEDDRERERERKRRKR